MYVFYFCTSYNTIHLSQCQQQPLTCSVTLHISFPWFSHVIKSYCKKHLNSHITNLSRAVNNICMIFKCKQLAKLMLILMAINTADLIKVVIDIGFTGLSFCTCFLKHLYITNNSSDWSNTNTSTHSWVLSYQISIIIVQDNPKISIDFLYWVNSMLISPYRITLSHFLFKL